MKICPVGAELFHAERQTGGYDGANSRFFFLILRTRLKTKKITGIAAVG